jgi:tRNA(Arg) A34 adenosine deaminase TadA
MIGIDEIGLQHLMGLAREQALEAIEKGYRPFGAVAAEPKPDGAYEVVAAAHNTSSENEPLAHAEINLIRATVREIGKEAMSDLVVVVNADPCNMCFNALCASGGWGGVLVTGAPTETQYGSSNLELAMAGQWNQVKLCVRGVDQAHCTAQVRAGRALMNPAISSKDREEQLGILKVASEQTVHHRFYTEPDNTIRGGAYLPWQFYYGQLPVKPLGRPATNLCPPEDRRLQGGYYRVER